MTVGKSVYKQKKRNTGRRKRNSIVFMIAEGKNKTEALYFSAYRRDTNRIIIFAPGLQTDPEKMVTGLRTFMRENDFDPELGDRAYCLIDTDVDKRKEIQIAHADKLASECGIQLIVSAPCFEYWYLCHFIFLGRKFGSNSELLSELKRYIPDYSKGAEGIYNLLKEKTENAVKNAKQIEQINLKNGYNIHTVEFTPSSEIYHIVEELGYPKIE